MTTLDSASETKDLHVTKEPYQILGFTRARLVFFLLFVAVVAIGPMVLYPIFLMKVYTFIIFACAYNLLLGFTGLMSFGHAAFFGMGAYLCGWTAVNLGLPPSLALLAGTAMGAVLGAIFGWVAIRRTGLYFAMITLALSQMVFFICLRTPFTGGEDGIQGVPRGDLFGFIPLGSDTVLYWTIAVITLLVVVLFNRIIHSPFGQVLRAIRNNPVRAQSLGYNVDRFKLISFIISAGLAGFAGSLKTIVFGIATLTDVSLVPSTEVVLINLVGGIGTIFGPVVGSFIILSIEHFLAPYGPYIFVFQGVVFMFFVLIFRQGLVGELQKLLKKHL
ncbi:MAG: branched-chain amino acid ABC transporter permease [Rhodobiaceae bacterium]|nr:branched-chain amino acid ABC transporter permease [Rhodobiaceae bacterium]MCC0054588.1 branched-chain amino acid ABC transporter permease [Rhodobiaceae bacterium]